MGWNSWDCYGAAVTEEILLKNTDYMAEHLKKYGWEYIVCDISGMNPLQIPVIIIFLQIFVWMNLGV